MSSRIEPEEVGGGGEGGERRNELARRSTLLLLLDDWRTPLLGSFGRMRDWNTVAASRRRRNEEGASRMDGGQAGWVDGWVGSSRLDVA